MFKDEIIYPHNIQAERAVLATLFENNALLKNLGFLSVDCFYEPIHQRIFEDLLEKFKNNEVANAITLADNLENVLEPVGGKQYLADLVWESCIITELADYTKQLYALAKERELYGACRNALLQAENKEKGFYEIAAELSSKLQKSVDDLTVRKIKTNHEVTTEIIADLKNNKAPVSTGLRSLDVAMEGGLYAGKAYGFAARKKIGKTILASTLSYNLNENNIPHLFICGEMSAKEIHQRQLARKLNISSGAFRNRLDEDPNLQARIDDVSKKSNGCIYYQNAPGLMFEDLKQYVITAIYKYRIKGFILDYWQLVGGKPKERSTAEHLESVAQWIADFCRQHDIWSITTAQINQDGNTRGSEGLRLAFDQVYQINKREDTAMEAWLEMMDTRYTAWMNVGNETMPGLMLNENGPYFQ